jgi:hypothetical protein
MTAQVIATHVWPASHEMPVAVEELVLDWGGPVGDRHHGLTMLSDTRQRSVFDQGTEIRNNRQLSLVDSEELADIAESMGIDRIAPGVIADNICTKGIPALTSLPPMTRMAFDSGAVIMLGGENNPCTIAGSMVQQVYGTRPEAFPKAAMHRRGVTAWVERPGVIRSGAVITLFLP